MISSIKFDVKSKSTDAVTQTTVTKTTITTTITTTTTTETHTVLPSPGSVPTNPHCYNVPDSQHSRSLSPSTTHTSMSSHASHPDDLMSPLNNQTVDGFYFVLTGQEPGIFFSM